MNIPLQPEPAPFGSVPSPRQLVWQRRKLSIFVHYGMNTFTDQEWGDGKASPETFRPEHLDVDQWAGCAKSAGAGGMVLTAKHHDGFCLWPTSATDYSVQNSPWKNGKGDVVRDFVDACRRHGLSPGLYLSPWDRHEPTYGDSERYNRFYLRQLTELLSTYGELGEIWFDGACGEGPGGKNQAYDWPAIFELCRRLQPRAVTFGDGGTDVRWIGNERGYAGESNWCMVDSGLVRFPGDAGIDRPTDARAMKLSIAEELEHGNPEGDVWRPGEVDVSIRPDWFYHQPHDTRVRSVSNLVDLYFRSVGRNAGLLLNVPPTPDGVFHSTDAKRLSEFGARIRELFRNDLFEGAECRVYPHGVEVGLSHPRRLNVLKLSEPIHLGQRVKRYRVAYFDETGEWQWLVDGDTVGHLKLDRFEAVTATRIRVEITGARAWPAPLSEVSAYLA